MFQVGIVLLAVPQEGHDGSQRLLALFEREAAQYFATTNELPVSEMLQAVIDGRVTVYAQRRPTERGPEPAFAALIANFGFPRDLVTVLKDDVG